MFWTRAVSPLTMIRKLRVDRLAWHRDTLQANRSSCLLAMGSRWSLIQLVEVLLHELLLLSNKLCAGLAPRPVWGKGQVRLANMGCWASKPGWKVVVVVARVMMMVRCGRGIEDRRGALARGRNRRRTLVTGRSALAGGVLGVDIIPDDEVNGHLVRAAKL